MKKSLIILTSLTIFFNLNVSAQNVYPSTGKVGLATVNPKEQLQIGDRWTFHNGGTKFIGYNVFYNGQDTRLFSDGASQIRFGSGGDIVFQTSSPGTPNTPVSFNLGLAIQNDGKVGIGIFPPTEKLDVAGNGLIRERLSIGGSDLILGTLDGRDQGTAEFENRALVHSNGGDRLVVNYNGDFEGGVDVRGPQTIIQGNLGIGVSGPSEKLEVDGNASIGNRLYVGGSDFTLGKLDGRDQGIELDNRALVHGWSDKLLLNYNGDFEGGVSIQGGKTVIVGKLGIGLNEPLAKLHLPGNEKFRLGPWEFSQEGGGNTGQDSYLRIDRWTGNGSSTWSEKKFAFDWAGRFIAQKVKVLDVADFPDYVFEDHYYLLPLSELEKYIREKGHLPDIPTAIEVEEQGLDLGEMDTKLLKKIEELTLYTIDQEKEIKVLSIENEQLNKRLDKIERLLLSQKRVD